MLNWNWHVIFEISGFLTPFLADSGGEEYDDGLLGWMKRLYCLPIAAASHRFD